MTLTINNSLSRIEGCSPEQFIALRELLSYSDESGAHFSGRYNTKKYLLDRKGYFPTGLLPRVQNWLKKTQSLHTLKDQRITPEPRQGLFRTPVGARPYPEQTEAAEAAKLRKRGIISAPTGLGKSVIIALIIHKLQVPTLVVVPSLELKRQLTATLKAAFGSLDHILVENVDALDPKKELKGYDCIIIDEFHRSASATYRKLNVRSWTSCYHRFGLTATPFRSMDSENILLESILSEVIYKIDYQSAVDNRRIVPMEAYYIDLPETKMRGNPDSWPAVYSELIVNNEYRNFIISHVMYMLTGSPTLTLVKEIAHGEILSLLTGTLFANGQDGNTRERILEFNLGETKSLIGTVGVIGEGVDTKPAEWIILAGGGKAKTQFMQNCGRGFRIYPGKETCKVIMFRDKSNKFLLRHFNACVKHLREEYNIKPVKLELTV